MNWILLIPDCTIVSKEMRRDEHVHDDVGGILLVHLVLSKVKQRDDQ